MKITTPEQLCSVLWRSLLLCSLAVLAMASFVTIRLAFLPDGPEASTNQMIEMACWRVSLLLAFQSAPLAWAHFIYKGYKHKLICIPCVGIWQDYLELRSRAEICRSDV